MAQKTLFNKYQKIVKDFILSKYSIYYDIDDDVSEILIKVFLNLGDYDIKKSKFKSWVLSITKNYIIDKWRCKTISLSSDNLSVSTLNYDSSFFNQTYNWNSTCFENINTINYISTQLSPSDFTLLDMKYIQGYNYNEIGSEFQITSNTVSNKINYIKTKLKKNIDIDSI